MKSALAESEFSETTVVATTFKGLSIAQQVCSSPSPTKLLAIQTTIYLRSTRAATPNTVTAARYSYFYRCYNCRLLLLLSLLLLFLLLLLLLDF